MAEYRGDLAMTSWVALDRIIEERKSSDAAYRSKVARRPLRSAATTLTEAQLLGKLRSFGFELDRSALERLCDRALSAQEIAKPFIDHPAFKTSEADHRLTAVPASNP